jgi:hypothetical protein
MSVPSVAWNLLVEVCFERGEPVDELKRLHSQLGEQILTAVEQTVSGYDAQVDLFDAARSTADTPLFPIRSEVTSIPSHLDVIELVERTCGSRSTLTRTHHDCLGRAYDIVVEIGYQRRPEQDDLEAGFGGALNCERRWPGIRHSFGET